MNYCDYSLAMKPTATTTPKNAHRDREQGCNITQEHVITTPSLRVVVRQADCARHFRLHLHTPLTQPNFLTQKQAPRGGATPRAFLPEEMVPRPPPLGHSCPRVPGSSARCLPQLPGLAEATGAENQHTRKFFIKFENIHHPIITQLAA